MREDVINAIWEHPTVVTDSLLLGSLRTLEPHHVQALANQGVQHAIVLCAAQLVRCISVMATAPWHATYIEQLWKANVPVLQDDGSTLSGQVNMTAALLHRLSMDSKLRTCLAACIAANIHCQLLPIRSSTSQVFSSCQICDWLSVNKALYYAIARQN